MHTVPQNTRQDPRRRAPPIAGSETHRPANPSSASMDGEAGDRSGVPGSHPGIAACKRPATVAGSLVVGVEDRRTQAEAVDLAHIGRPYCRLRSRYVGPLAAESGSATSARSPSSLQGLHPSVQGRSQVDLLTSPNEFEQLITTMLGGQVGFDPVGKLARQCKVKNISDLKCGVDLSLWKFC